MIFPFVNFTVAVSLAVRADLVCSCEQYENYVLHLGSIVCTFRFKFRLEIESVNARFYHAKVFSEVGLYGFNDSNRIRFPLVTRI